MLLLTMDFLIPWVKVQNFQKSWTSDTEILKLAINSFMFLKNGPLSLDYTENKSKKLLESAWFRIFYGKSA